MKLTWEIQQQNIWGKTYIFHWSVGTKGASDWAKVKLLRHF